MKTYYVTFQYTMQVTAPNEEDANGKAWEEFRTTLKNLSHADFTTTEPEQEWWFDMEVKL